jgi:very-short-patch-repair endonuclease
LRRNSTEAERAAWHLLRGGRLGAKFRRQCRMENWVVDFYCFERRPAIELDWGVHSQPSQMWKDAAKEDYLRTLGTSLLRIPNGLVLGGCGKTRCRSLCSAGILPASDESKGVAGWKPALRPAPKEFFRNLLGDPEGFVRRVWEAIKVETDEADGSK